MLRFIIIHPEADLSDSTKCHGSQSKYWSRLSQSQKSQFLHKRKSEMIKTSSLCTSSGKHECPHKIWLWIFHRPSGGTTKKLRGITEASGIQGLRSNCGLLHRWCLIEAVEMASVDPTWTEPVYEWVKARMDEQVKVRVNVPTNACALVAWSQQAGGSVTSLTDRWFSVEHWTLMIITELCWLKSYSLSVGTNYPDWHAAVAPLWAERSGLPPSSVLSGQALAVKLLFLLTMQIQTMK